MAEKEAASARVNPPHRQVLTSPLLSSILSTRETLTPEEWEQIPHIDSARYLVLDDEGRWHRPRDTLNFLTRQIPSRRLVSAALTDAQSRQLITAFYLLSVERVSDPAIAEAASLILFRYMFERGYTARYMGKYIQDAMYIGNGIRYRTFKRLTQYDPDRLPIEVLSKLCGTNGRLINRGSKGTRSKYRTTNRYVPTRRLKRSREDEDQMMTAGAPPQATRVSGP